jgi:hypothetical protein
MCSMRPRISRAALLVKVTARIEWGENCSARISQAMRCTSTRVLPEPGTGQHQHVATLGGHRLALRIVETGENIADVHPRHSNRHGMPASPAQSPA